MKTTQKSQWVIPLGLLALAIVPTLGGAIRMSQLISGDLTPENARFLSAPWSFSLHIVAATLFCLLGPLQFVPSLRQRKAAWHRILGRLLVPCGFVTSLTGIWMAQSYPQYGLDTSAVYGMRLIVGILMTYSLGASMAAIYRRDIPRHQVWIIRAYALALGVGTQALTHIPWFIFPQLQTEFFRAVFMGAGWIINMAVAEWIIWGLQKPRRSFTYKEGVVHESYR